MKMRKTTAPALLSALLWLTPALAGAAAGPSNEKVSADVIKHWKKAFPEQKVEHVTKKADCENTTIVDEAHKAKTNQDKTLKACLIRADVFIAHGYRYQIFRGTEAYYVSGKLQKVQPGPEEIAWKEGGVPPPSRDDALKMITELARQKWNAPDAALTILEMGQARQAKTTYRMSFIVDVQYTANGKTEKKTKQFAVLENDGLQWKASPELSF